MFKNYLIKLEIKYDKNTNDNPHDFIKTIKHEYWDCNFYIINNIITIYKNNTKYTYDLTEVDDISFKQLRLDDKNKERWSM